MPVNWSNYPKDWKQIARSVKDGCGWVCQMCGMQCRKPGEPFDTHKRTMSVMHLNHDTSDNTASNLRGACSACHLRYDAPHHAKNAARTRSDKRRRAIAESGQKDLGL